MNSMFGYANKAMGLAYLQEENYAMAMHYARLAADRNTYSEAFWEERNVWIRENIIAAAIILIAIYAVYKTYRFCKGKKGIFNGAARILTAVRSKHPGVAAEICILPYEASY